MAQAQENLTEMNWNDMPEPKEKEFGWLPPLGATKFSLVGEKIKTVNYNDKQTGEPKSFRQLCVTVKDEKGEEHVWEVSIYEDYSPKSLLGQLYYLAKTWGNGTLVGLNVMVVATEDKRKDGSTRQIYQVFKQ